MPREAPIAEWAAQFESSGLTEQQIRTAVGNQKARREAGTAEEEAADAARAANAAELKKQIVRTDSLCPALSVLCSVE